MMIVYKPKANFIICILFAIVLAVLLIFAVSQKNAALLCIALVFTLLTLYIFYSTHYTIFENQLIIKSGFIFNESIFIDSIKKITRKRNTLLSGLRLSFYRLIIEYNVHDCIIISPHQQKQFIDHLKRINPDIEIY